MKPINHLWYSIGLWLITITPLFGLSYYYASNSEVSDLARADAYLVFILAIILPSVVIVAAQPFIWREHVRPKA